MLKSYKKTKIKTNSYKLLQLSFFFLLLGISYACTKDEDNNHIKNPNEEITDSINSSEIENEPIMKTDTILVNGFETVDLGLSVRWATCNVGADYPEEFGDYYSWGEIKNSENNRGWVGYKWCNSSWGVMIKYCTKSNSRYGTVDYKTTLEQEDDIAHLSRGESWRIPTKNEFKELMDSCIWSWTTIFLNESKTDSINGYKVVGTNGNSIFLPAAGFYGEHGLKNRNKSVCYWSSTLFDFVECHSAYCLYFNKEQYSLKYGNRYYGTPIRPVCD